MFFFFFQAEDGIRDVAVTGVQTCALPIYMLVVPASNPSVAVFAAGGLTFSAPASGDVLFTVDAQAAVPMSGANRSEEHTSELQSRLHIVCRLLLVKKKRDYDNSSTRKRITAECP